MKLLKVEKAYISSQNQWFSINADWSIDYAYNSLLDGISRVLVIEGTEYDLKAFEDTFINKKVVTKKAVNKMCKTLTSQQLERVQTKIKAYIRMAKYIDAEKVVKALEIDLKYCSNWTVEDATRILTITKRDLVEVYGYNGYNNSGVGAELTQDYIYNTIIKGLNTYHMMNIRTYTGSKTKNKIIIKSFMVGANELHKTRAEWLKIGKEWVLDNNIVDNTISFEVI